MKKLVAILFSIFLMMQTSFAQEIDTEKYCDKIVKTEDKFKDEIKYRTPLSSQILFQKNINDEEEIIYMRISTIGATPATGTGVILLLENGEKITKNVETSVDVNINAQFEHSAFLTLSRSDIELLKEHNITDIRLYIFDMEIKDPIQYRAYMICLDDLK